jgi:phospholipase/carboxylesterase
MNNDFTTMSVKDLKTYIAEKGGNTVGLVEKQELIALAQKLSTITATTTTTSSNNNNNKKDIFAGVNMLPLSIFQNNPPSTRPKKILIMLHGYGADNQQFNFLNAIIPNIQTYYYVVQPKSPGFGWFPLDSILNGLTSSNFMTTLQQLFTTSPKGLLEARSIIINLYRELLLQTKLSPSDVILGGFSQGATLALDVALELEETCGGVLAFSGFPVDLERWKKNAMRHGNKLHVLSTHGKADTLIPYLATTFIRQTLTSGNIQLEAVDHDGGHELGNESISAMVKFLQ